jgi:nitroreductase
MDLTEAIYTRQTISKVRADALPRGVIEDLLGAAVQAPNHHRSRPWRFVVLTGAAREELGAVMARSLLQREPDAGEGALETERKRPLRSPVIIAVGIDRAEGDKISEIENICAGAAAVENLLLAAHAKGLGAVWRTGPAATDAAVKAFLGFEPDQPLIALVYVGYPAGQPGPIDRPGFHDRTRWMEAS